MKKTAMLFAFTLALGATTSQARAETHGLYFSQAGALLAYADAELKVLYGALTAKEFDPKLTKDTVAELDRTLASAKRSVDRSIALLPESQSKVAPELEKLRTAIKQCEDALNKLGNDITEQTGSTEETEAELGARPEENLDEEPPQRDWELLKRGTGWLGVDLKDARGKYGAVARKLRLKSLRSPPKPRGKRPE